MTVNWLFSVFQFSSFGSMCFASTLPFTKILYELNPNPNKNSFTLFPLLNDNSKLLLDSPTLPL